MRACDRERVFIRNCMHACGKVNKNVYWRYNASENEPPPSVKAGYEPALN